MNPPEAAPGTVRQPVQRKADARAARVVDIALALVGLVVAGPFLLARAIDGRLRSGRWLDPQERIGLDRRPFRLLRLAGEARGAGLAALGNVLGGSVSLVGPRPLRPGEEAGHAAERFAIRPGLVSRHGLRARTGVDYLPEVLDDADFARCAGLRDRLGLLLRAGVVAVLYGGARASRDAGEIEILGVPVANGTMDAAIDWMIGRARGDRPTVAAFVNPHCMNVAESRIDYRRALLDCDRIFPDGIGMRVAARFRGTRLVANVNGTDLFPRLAARAAREGLPIFFLGAAPGVAAEAARRLAAETPGLRVAGARDGFFTADEEGGVIAEIRASGAKILAVAMGVPLQELWLARHRADLGVPLALGVGGLFDFCAGRIPRAPLWLRELGLEWAWRLLQEPRRMWRRYLVGNAVFLGRTHAEARIARVPHEERIARLFEDRPLQLARRRQRAAARRAARRLAVAAFRGAKRALDVVGAATALILLSPLLGLAALLVRIDSAGPIFFRQTRVGRGGREFAMLKFRSMYVDAEARRATLDAANEMNGGVTFKMRRDPRITRVGRVLRKLSIDEMPQLWHVLTGEMSLVGPRPPLPSEVALYSLEDRRRLAVTPGLTCIWQVSGRSDIPFERQVELDASYIHEQSIWLDVKLLARTVPAVVLGRGAY